MLNREWQSVTVRTFVNELDEYGQKRQGQYVDRTEPMVCKLYHQSNDNNIQYVDVDMIAITKDKTITDANQIIINSVKYNVGYIIPSKRLQQLLLRKVV